MTTFEELFNKSVLAVITPESTVGFPSQGDTSYWDKWVGLVEDENLDRKMAFFDENLEIVLALRFEHVSFDGETDINKPPPELLSFLAHVQVSYEATYITSLPQAPSPSPLEMARPPVPPRSHSIPVPTRNKPTPLAPPQAHPSIFPPHTPHPIPSTADSDRQYVQAQGTPLRSATWGDGSAPPNSESFAMVWSKRDNCWMAVFKMSIQVAFIPTKVADPLLCLTVSATLREKPVAVTPARQTLTALIEASGALSANDPTTPLVKSGRQDEEDALNGLEEVNLLDGLSGPTFSSKEMPLMLPSSRLGESIRKQAFGLNTPDTGMSTPVAFTPTTYRPSHPTLRKAFRKTLRTVSGFRVRMRTVFVPYFMLPQSNKKKANKGSRQSVLDKLADSDSEDDVLSAHERELREAGNEEHTVVLCVEVENGGEASAGFAVESVKVTVGGEGAQTHLIGWGDSGFLQSDLVFPLRIGPHEQYNLLYAVTFTRSPEVDEFSLARGRGLPGVPMVQEMQRAVAIIINGKPYEVVRSEGEDIDTPIKSEQLSYPTSTFPSRWNCILDLSPQANNVRRISSGPGEAQHEAMPTPASPFPGAVTGSRPTSANVAQPGILVKPGTPITTKAPAPVVAGSKRFTMSAMDAQANEGYFDSVKSRLTSPVNYRSGASLLNPANQRDTYAQSGFQQISPSTPTGGLTVNPTTQNRASYLPPSATMKTFSRTPTTTYGPLSPPLPSIPRSHSYGHVQDDSISSQIADIIPPTPAYPAFPTSPPPTTPHWQGPIANMQSGAVGPSVEIRREKGPNAAGIPPTPGPRISAAGGFVQMQSQGETLRDVVAADGPGEPIVVSVGLLRDTDGEAVSASIGKIHPLDQFTLDIFVFNRSSWTRRFEVSYPDRRKQRKEKMYFEARDGSESKAGSNADTPGIIPLANRVRIGPLLPSTCQSVRMDFLALTPGVHSVDTLTLTDIQSGFSMNLRSVMDIVVHEPELSHESSKISGKLDTTV